MKPYVKNLLDGLAKVSDDASVPECEIPSDPREAYALGVRETMRAMAITLCVSAGEMSFDEAAEAVLGRMGEPDDRIAAALKRADTKIADAVGNVTPFRTTH